MRPLVRLATPGRRSLVNRRTANGRVLTSECIGKAECLPWACGGGSGDGGRYTLVRRTTIHITGSVGQRPTCCQGCLSRENCTDLSRLPGGAKTGGEGYAHSDERLMQYLAWHRHLLERKSSTWAWKQAERWWHGQSSRGSSRGYRRSCLTAVSNMRAAKPRRPASPDALTGRRPATLPDDDGRVPRNWDLDGPPWRWADGDAGCACSAGQWCGTRSGGPLFPFATEQETLLLARWGGLILPRAEERHALNAQIWNAWPRKRDEGRRGFEHRRAMPCLRGV